jgi:hypothetical protein
MTGLRPTARSVSESTRWADRRSLVERCAGLDAHRDTVVACVGVPGPHGEREAYTKTFGTTTAELLRLGNWLVGWQVTRADLHR